MSAAAERKRVAEQSQCRRIAEQILDDDNEYDEEEADWLEMECGLMADGQCGMAGTEHCDFSCPNRDSEDFCGSAAWNKKHGIQTR